MFDQITLFMIFMMLCFAGIVAMFYFILRGLDELTRELRGERTQLIGIMHSLESNVDLLVKAAQLSLKHQAGRNAPSKPGAMEPGAEVDYALKTPQPEQGSSLVMGKSSVAGTGQESQYLRLGKTR